MKGTPCLLSVKRKTYINLKLFAYSGSNPNGKLATILISRQKYFRNILTTYKIYCMLIHRYLKFDTKLNGKPVKSRLPVFCLHVVYLPDLAQEKIFLIF